VIHITFVKMSKFVQCAKPVCWPKPAVRLVANSYPVTLLYLKHGFDPGSYYYSTGEIIFSRTMSLSHIREHNRWKF